MSHDGFRLISAAKNDATIKVFDVMAFDMIDIIRVDLAMSVIEFVNYYNSPSHIIAIGVSEKIELYKLEDGSNLKSFNVHAGSTRLIKFNKEFNTVVSIDDQGIIEY